MRVPQVAAILRTKITRHPDGSETVSRDVFFDAFEVFWTYVFAQLLELYRAATLSTRRGRRCGRSSPRRSASQSIPAAPTSG